MNRVFGYYRNFSPNSNGETRNMYLKLTYRTLKRNPTLMCVPSMFYISRGKREYMTELYGKFTINKPGSYSFKRQVVTGTIPHNRNAMTNTVDFLMPDLYGVAFYGDYILSPFNYNNRIYYRYRISKIGNGQTLVHFRQRTNNTQLVKGYAIVESYTGRIIRTKFSGEYDMLHFQVHVNMGEENTDNSIIPVWSETNTSFNFLGNKIRANLFARYNCPTTLKDSIDNSSDMSIMEKVRPEKLSESEKKIYSDNTETHEADSTRQQDTRLKKIGDFAWEHIGDKILNRLDGQNSKISYNLSPLFNPLYMGYSQSRGLAYKLNLSLSYKLTENAHLSFYPNLGYNFKIKQFYYSIPLRYTFNNTKNAWIELNYANGNRINSAEVLDMIKNENRDTIDFQKLPLDYFDDNMFRISGNVKMSNRLELNCGINYHIRTAVNKEELEAINKTSTFRSFSPFITLSYRYSMKSPVFTANYERGIKDVMRSDIEYERWEFDVSYRKNLMRLQRYNLRFGAGIYTNKTTKFFVDFSNFHANFLPEGWDDDWSGNFQLVNDNWYNSSKYYIRANTSYESPMLLLTRIPFIGRYIENERIYLNALQIEHTKPYFEFGYGVTNRFFSIGIFTSTLNGKIYEFGSKLTFELFRKW